MRTLLEWHHAGEDIDRRIPLLSTYLGHADPASTYWYLEAVPELRFVTAAEELGTYTLKPNLPALGPRFGKHMPELRAAIAALDPAAVAAALRDGRTVSVSTGGDGHELGPDDLAKLADPIADKTAASSEQPKADEKK